MSVSPGHSPLRRLLAVIALAVLPVLVMVAAATGAPDVAPLPMPAATATPQAEGSVSSDLRAVAAKHPSRTVEVIVQLDRGVDRGRTTAALERSGAKVSRQLPLIRAVVARLAARDAAALAKRPGVRAVSINAAAESSGAVDPAKLATSFNQSIRADRVWALGATGKGVGVAVIDTGIAGDLPDFRRSQSDPTSRVVANVVTNPAARDARDTFGHGTHIAGLIAGNGTNRAAGDPAFGRYAGVAPDANLISIKADDGQGNTTVADVIDGLQFAVDFKSEYNIRVVNLSLRSSHAESYKTDPLDAAVEQAWFSGIVVVAAAGNAGTSADAVQFAPGNDPHIITVGAVDDLGTKDIADDRLTAWSSRGRTQDGFEKPDVVAPGAKIVAPLAPGSYYGEACPSCVVDGSYLRIGGTSMAAAVVSGEIAALLEAYPSWTPRQVKATLVKRTRAVESPTATGFVDATGDPVLVDSASETVAGAEAAADKAYANPTSITTVEAPINTWLDPGTRLIDFQRVSWSRVSWSTAPDALTANWSRVSWSRVGWSRVSWSATTESCRDLERAGWTRVSWSDADVTSAKAECLAHDPAASWTSAAPVQLSRVSWSTSFDR